MWQLLVQLAALLSTRVGVPARFHLELAERRRIRYYCVQFCSVVGDKNIGNYFYKEVTGKMHIIQIISWCLVQYFYIVVLVYLCLLLFCKIKFSHVNADIFSCTGMLISP